MLLRKMSFVCNRRVLMILFYFHLVLLGVVLIIAYDINASPKEAQYLKAYNRWKSIRENFDSYHEARGKKDARLQMRGRQMDVVAGFDFLGVSRDRKSNLSKSDSVIEQVFESSLENPLNFIPKVPQYSVSDIVPYLSSNITKKYLQLPRTTYTYKIVILTPVCDVAHLLDNFMKQLAKLSYPHDLLSIYFGEDSSSDRTFDMATLIADDLKSNHGFHDAAAYHFNASGGVHGPWGEVHSRSSQYERRAHLAASRNTLLKVGLTRGEFDYVLWVDSDIKQLPVDLIEQLIFAKSDVVVPSCLFQSGEFKRTFDKNSWRETPASVEDQEHLPKDILIVEGYSVTRRIYLPDLKAEGRVVRLDGVGGCALLIKANCHRRGLRFPEKIYSHHIETEGLAKMADHMGFTVVGVPFVEVFHN